MSAKKKYKINPETLAMEQVEHGFRYWLRQTGIYILAGIVIGIGFLYLFLIFFPSPREKQLLREQRQQNAEIQLEIDRLNNLIENGDDADFIEDAARERLGFVFPNEEVYKSVTGN